MGIVDRIRDMIVPMGHTIASLERELSFSSGSIRKWDEKTPSADRLYKVAKFLSVSMEYILTGDLSSTVHIPDVGCEAKRIALIYEKLGTDDKTILMAEALKLERAMQQTTPPQNTEHAKLA